MDSRFSVEIFSIKKSKQLLTEWFAIPKVVLCPTLKCHWKELFCICETEKYKTLNLTSFHTSLISAHRRGHLKIHSGLLTILKTTKKTQIR